MNCCDWLCPDVFGLWLQAPMTGCVATSFIGSTPRPKVDWVEGVNIVAI